MVFLRKRRRWAFLNTLQALDPPAFKSFSLTFLRNDFEHQSLLKNSEIYRLFFAVVRCCVTPTLVAETVSLLNVYLNYKFGLGLPIFYLIFSMFKNKGWTKAICFYKVFVLFIDFYVSFQYNDLFIKYKWQAMCALRCITIGRAHSERVHSTAKKL